MACTTNYLLCESTNKRIPHAMYYLLSPMIYFGKGLSFFLHILMSIYIATVKSFISVGSSVKEELRLQDRGIAIYTPSKLCTSLYCHKFLIVKIVQRVIPLLYHQLIPSSQVPEQHRYCLRSGLSALLYFLLEELYCDGLSFYPQAENCSNQIMF